MESVYQTINFSPTTVASRRMRKKRQVPRKIGHLGFLASAASEMSDHYLGNLRAITASKHYRLTADDHTATVSTVHGHLLTLTSSVPSPELVILAYAQDIHATITLNADTWFPSLHMDIKNSDAIVIRQTVRLS